MTLPPVTDGVITLTPEFTLLEDAWMSGIGAIARRGANVLIEDGFLGGIASQNRWMEALAGLSIFWVGVICDEQTAVIRERARGDRDAGMASSQRLLVHRGILYHCIVDTTDGDSSALANDVLAAMRAAGSSEPPHLTL